MSGASNPTVEFIRVEGPLMPFVESFYLFRDEALVLDGVDRVDMAHLRFMLKGSGYRIFPDGHREPSCPVMINGPGGGAAGYHLDGPFHCFGASLRAVGWKSLVGLPAHKVTNQVVDGAEIFGRAESMALLARLQRMDRIEDMIAVTEPFLLARRHPVPKAHVALARAVREWAASGERGIRGIYDRVEMSERQATRLCNEYFGGPPKLLERKYRAVRAAMKIYQGEDPADAAEPFADQPHMIKEIKYFTGHTPTTLRSGIDPVVAITLDNESFHFLPEVIPESVDLDGN